MLTPFTITLDLARAERADDPLAFIWQTTRYVRRLRSGARRTAELVWDEALGADLARASDGAAAERLGARLRRLLLDLSWGEDEAALLAAVEAGLEVVIRLELAAAELYALPWELCHVGEAGLSLANLPGVYLRYAWPGVRSASHPTPPEGGSVLLAWSASAGAVPAGEHIAAVRAALTAGSLPFDELEDVLANASYEALSARLAAARRAGHPYAVLHVLAHGAGLPGGATGLALDDGVRDGAALRELLAEHAADLRLVVLCVCQSGDSVIAHPLGSLAWQVHRAGVASVIASRQPLSVAGSIVLAHELYGGLAAHDPPLSLEAALSRARAALRGGNVPSDATSLQSYASQDLGDDTRPFQFRPYRGLLAFGPEHRRFFFGREAERDELRTELLAQIDQGRPRISIVEGASGSGKSSLVMAAVVPALEDQGWRFARMVPGSSPLATLEATLAPLLAGQGDQRRLLVVDQLEEIFTLTPEDRREERDRFAARLWSLAAQTDGRLSLVATLRADFRGRCGEVRLSETMRLDGLFTSELRMHHLFVPLLGPDGLRSAIEGPARAVGLRLEEGLANRMIDDAGGEPGALPLLQFALDRMWQERQDGALTQQAYDTLGGVTGALRAQADAALLGLDVESLPMARRLLVRLVGHAGEGSQDTRRRVLLSTLRPVRETDRFDAIVDRLVRERLLVRSAGLQGEIGIEVAHEALIRSWPRLRTWLTEDRARLVEVDKIEALAARWREFPAELLGDDALGYARQVRDRGADDLSPLALSLIVKSEEFVAAQQAMEEKRTAKERRRTRVQLGVAGLAVVVLAWQFAFAKYAAEQAEASELQAIEATQRAAQSKDEANRARAEGHVATTFAAELDPTVQVAMTRDLYGRVEPEAWRQMAMDALQKKVARRILKTGDHIAVGGIVPRADGRRFVTRFSDGAIRIWSLEDAATPLRLGGEQRSFTNMWVHEGAMIVTTDSAGLVQLWDFDGAERRKWTVPGGEPWAALLSKDGGRLAVASADGRVRVFATDGDGPPIVLAGGPEDFSYLSVADDGSVIVESSGDTLHVWPATGGPPRRLRGDDGTLTELAFSPDNLHVATATVSGVVTIWRVDGVGEPDVLRGHEDRVNFIAWSPDGRWLASGSRDKTLRIWDATGEDEPRVLYGHGDGLTSGGFLDDQTPFSGSTDGTVRIWNRLGLNDPTILRDPTAAIGVAVASSDTWTLLTLSLDNTARVWDLAPRRHPEIFQVARTETGHDALQGVRLSPDGRWLLWRTVDLPLVGLYDREGALPPRYLEGHAGVVTDAVFSPDGQHLATAASDGAVRVWPLEGDAPPVVLDGAQRGALSLAYSPDGSRIVTTAYDETTLVRSPDGLGNAVELMAPCVATKIPSFSPSGRQIAMGCEGTIRVIDADGLGPAIDLVQPSTLRSMIYGTSDDIILAGYADGSVLRWDLSRPDTPTRLGHLSAAVYELALRPDGALVAAGDQAGLIGLWPVGGGEGTLLRGHRIWITGLVFSPDGETLLSTSTDETARLWDLDDASSLVLRGAIASTHSPTFTANGSQFMVASDDGTMRFWPTDLSPEALLERLWAQTDVCLDPEQRRLLLSEDEPMSVSGYDTCRRTIEARTGR